jgi:hypothetical protein
VPTAEIPATWPRVYALDVGWNRTAVIWGAKDPGTGRIVLYDEHYRAGRTGQPRRGHQGPWRLDARRD